MPKENSVLSEYPNILLAVWVAAVPWSDVLVELSVLFFRQLVLSSSPQTLITVTSSSLASLTFMLSHFIWQVSCHPGRLHYLVTWPCLPFLNPFFYHFKKKGLTLNWKSLFNASFCYLSGFMPSLSYLWLPFHVLVVLTCIAHTIHAVSTVRAFPCQSIKSLIITSL